MRRVEPKQSYLVIGSKPWNRRVFADTISKQAGRWYFVGTRAELSMEKVRSIDPRYLFFLHWSWKVPSELVNQYECVCFHMTDIPYGRGGSPLQNLILRGHTHTKLSAFRMTGKLDAGPVYLKQTLSLAGTAEDIYIRAARLAAQMIERIVTRNVRPVEQTGMVTIFQRRKREQSKVPPLPSLRAVYDFIRMLDAEGYPKAFIVYKGFRYELSRARVFKERVVSEVTITPLRDEAE
jgi:methionyl-tRNA formyltransferase